MEEQLLTVVEVAEYLKVDRYTIYRMVAAGQIPAFKVGNQWRFKKSLIEKWLIANLNMPRRPHIKVKRRRK